MGNIFVFDLNRYLPCSGTGRKDIRRTRHEKFEASSFSGRDKLSLDNKFFEIMRVARITYKKIYKLHYD